MRDMISLGMDQDAADFYIEHLTAYALKHDDVGVRDDANELRRQYELVWDSYAEE